MAASTLLFISGSIVLFAYFAQYSRVLNTLTTEERAIFYKAGASPVSLLGILTAFSVFLVPYPYLKAGLAVAAIAILIYAKKPHHHRLEERGLGTQFIQRLDGTFRLSMIGLTLIFAGAVMESVKYA